MNQRPQAVPNIYKNGALKSHKELGIEDKPVFTYCDEIDKSHPCRTDNEKSYEADSMAMKLVGERHGKRDLVNLVRWLIMDNAKTVNDDLPTPAPSIKGE